MTSHLNTALELTPDTSFLRSMCRASYFNMEMNQQDAQILITSLYFRMLDMFRTL